MKKLAAMAAAVTIAAGSIAQTGVFAEQMNNGDEEYPLSAAEKKVCFEEDFESDGVIDNITNGTNGWPHSSEGYEHYSVDVFGNTGNQTKQLRQAVADEWWQNNYLWLNLYDSGVAKLTADGADPETAGTEMRSYLSGDATVSFDMTVGIPNPKDMGESYARIKDANGNTLLGISFKDLGGDTDAEAKGQMVINNVLNAEMNGGAEYVCIPEFTYTYNAEENTYYSPVYNIKMEFKHSDNTVRLSINGNTAETEPGEWIPISNADNSGKADSFGMLREIEFAVYSGAWWQSLYVDNIKIEAEKAEAPEEPDIGYAEGVHFAEGFESSGISNVISAETKGWSYDGITDDEGYHHKECVNLWVGDNGSGSGSSLRYSNGEKWFGTTWLNLDLRTNGIGKYRDAGYTNAEAIVDKYLTDDSSISFKTKFEVQSADPGGGHEQYIRLKGDRYNVISELVVKDGVLYLKALSADGTQDTMYQIGSVDISQNNNQWHTFRLDLDKSENTYVLTVDGTVFEKTPYGRNIPAGAAGDEDRSIGKLGYMEFGHYRSGWWQCMYIDDIVIADIGEDTAPAEWGVEDFNIDAQGNYSFKAVKGGASYDDAFIIAALYDGEKLAETKMYSDLQFNDASEYTAEGSFDLPQDGGELSVKVFIWHGEMIPAAEVYESSLGTV